ncbi:MAG: HAD hydrolase family protein [Eubacteriales bacterium]
MKGFRGFAEIKGAADDEIRKKILLSDLDGTLLDSSSKVSVENQQAIKTFIAQGGHFGIATGRSQLNAVAFLDHVEINTPSILYNGCALYDFEAKKIPGAVQTAE